jgi:predicted phage terminase large subunit-like protein
MSDESFDLSEASGLQHLASPLALGASTIPNFRPRIHQRLISNAIVNAVHGDGKKRIAISLPAQFGKSFVASILTPAWYLENFAYGLVPGGFVGLVSAEDSLVLYFSNQCRRLIKNNPDTFMSSLRLDSRAASFWETEQGAGMIATGITGSIVGRPISLLIIDDAVKTPEQANSERHRDLVWDFWQSVGLGRLQPWSVVLCLMTRWSEDDLIGRLLSPDYPGDPNDWEYVRVPAVCDDEKNDPCGRKLGDALMRPQWDGTQEEANAEMQKVKESTSDFYWATMWMQEPRDPEGTIWYERCWWYYGPKPTIENGQYPFPQPKEFDQVVISWDLAFKATSDTDYVVGQAWGGKSADRYLIDQIRGRWSFVETKGRVRSFAERIRSTYPQAMTVLVEDKANGPAIIDELRSTVGGLVEFNVHDYGSKEARAHACQPLLTGGNLYIPCREIAPWVTGFVGELAAFPRGKFDDQNDCATQALLHMARWKHFESTIITGTEDDLSFRATSLNRR